MWNPKATITGIYLALFYGALVSLMMGSNCLPVIAAACDGSPNCTICTNCSRCRHCKYGGTCGVCAPSSSRQRTPARTPAYYQPMPSYPTPSYRAPNYYSQPRVQSTSRYRPTNTTTKQKAYSSPGNVTRKASTFEDEKVKTYIRYVQQRIQESWGTYEMNNATAHAIIVINKQGNLASAKVVSASGPPSVRDKVIEAIQYSTPFGKPPITSDTLRISVKFRNNGIDSASSDSGSATPYEVQSNGPKLAPPIVRRPLPQTVSQPAPEPLYSPEQDSPQMHRQQRSYQRENQPDENEGLYTPP